MDMLHPAMFHPLAIITLAVGIYMAWNIGANDVANAMGTSVGSGALTFRRAVILAGIFEFAGAVLVGAHVTDTVRKGIVDTGFFIDDPMLLAYGMCGSLLAASIWLNLSTWFGLPVSTTHSIVGAIAGFGIAAGGLGVVAWDTLGLVVASWVISPVMGGLIAFGVFNLIRSLILNKADPTTAARKVGPWLLVPVGMILTLSVVFKGLKNLKLDLTMMEALPWSLLVGGLLMGVGMLWIPRILRRATEDPAGRAATEENRFYPVESVFVLLQIATACLVAFAHGANDVANAVGPIAAVFGILKDGALASKVDVPIWILMMGGTCIVLGLATFGYRVVQTVGHKVTAMTPTRGFSAEFAAAVTILIGSRMGIPLSTTHVLVGSVIGVGLARGLAALNAGVIRSIAFSWLATVPVAAALSAGAFLFAVNVLASDDRSVDAYPSLPIGPIVLNELVAQNATGVSDELGGFDDWFEVVNTGDRPVSLAGYMTGDAFTGQVAAGWAFPSVTLEPGAHFQVWADGAPEEGPNHANFKLQRKGELLVLWNPRGRIVDIADYDEIGRDRAYARIPDGVGAWEITASPTPGAENRLTAPEPEADAEAEE